MLKNLKKAAAIVLSFAMAVQFGLADSYYVNAVEEPVEPQQEETTTTAPQEQEEVPTTEEETPQQQEEGQQQPAVEEEQPAAEEAQPQPQPQPVEQAEVKVSYVKEDGTDLMESVTATYDVGYRLDQDTNVFKEAHEAFEFEYAFVNGNKENKITKDQVKASGLTVTSDMTSLTLVYKSTATQNESKDKKVETANLSGEKEDDSDSEDDIATVANNSIELKVGEKATLDSSDVEDWGYNYQHKWTVNKKNIVNLSSKSGSSITVTGEGVGTATVTDTYTYSSFMGGSKRGTKTYTINVTAAVTPTGISISGADTVKQFQTTQLTANLTPEGANGKVTWTSSNEQILSVDENGLVTGNRQGSATITASVQGADKNTLSATKTIEVVKNESPSSGNKREALVYYLKDPTKDANSNGSDQWGPSSLGTAVVNVEGATWTGNKNCFDNVDQRVLSWPTDLNGTNVVPRSNNAWNLIFDAYKASIEKELKVTITKDDVEEITLVPAKISKDNGTTPDMHLDCNVNIKCKSVALVKYWLFDANGTKYEMLGSKNYLVKDESTTQPSDVTSKKFPTTKTVDGVTYTFSGWYTDQSLTTPAPSFPAKVTGSVNYYAKYVAGYQVKYNLAGGQFSDGSTSATEKHNVDTTVVVKEAPTRKGYKFTGWTVEGLDDTTTINSGESFTMPNGNVELTARWTIESYDLTINYVYEGGAIAAEPHTETLDYNTAYSVTSPVISGYTASSLTVEGNMPAEDKTITVVYSANTNTAYTVRHLFQNTTQDGYDLNVEMTQTLAGTTGFATAAKAEIVKGFTAKAFGQRPIAGDGSTVIDIYYDRNTVTLTYSITGDYFTDEEFATVSGVYGTAVTPSEVPSQTGYTFSGWTNEPSTFPATSMTVTGEYTIRTDLHYEIHYFYDGVENEEEMIVNDNATFNSPITISAPATKDVNGVNYMLESIVGLDKLVSVNADENIINVYYTKDSNGGETDPNDPTNPNKPDGIPDKYQVKVSYKAVNGTLNFIETYVTLYDEEGNYSETGKGILDAKQIPYASPNNGYNNGKWDVEPTVGMEITKDAEFTITFSAIPPVVPAVTPATPSTPSTTPRTPSAPQVTTPVETVEKETTPKAEPKKEEKVEEEYTPKASPQYYWALINLICAILTVLFGLLLLISKRHKSEDDEEDDDETKDQTTTNEDEEKEQEKKRGLFTRVLAVLIAILSVVFFLVTEDLSLPWTWTDQWTIWMVVIGLVQIVVFFVGRKWKNVDNDDDDDEEAQQA